MNLGAVIAKGDQSGGRRDLRIGVCRSIDWTVQIADVSFDGSANTIPCRMSGDAPRPGEPVWVLFVDDLALTIEPPSRPPLGKVVGSPSAGQVSVLSDNGQTYVVGFQTGYTPADGHRVLIDWRGGGFILIRVDAESVAPAPDPGASGGGQVARSKTFNAMDSGSYRTGGGWQTGAVYFGSSFPSAGYFYGPQMADSIPDTAPITAARVYLEVLQASGAGTMTLSLHTSATRPGGNLALDQTINIGAMPAGFRGDVTLPTSWGDLLKTGARLGIGTSGPGLRVLKGTNQQPAAGAITLDWKE